MVKEFNSINEIKKYYNKKTNTYIFKKNGQYIDKIKFNFDLNTISHIDAWNIYGCYINVANIDAYNINAKDIYAYNIYAKNIVAQNICAININACNIKADDISYYAVCFAYESIKCNSIKGRRENAKHFVLDGKIEIKDE